MTKKLIGYTGVVLLTFAVFTGCVSTEPVYEEVPPGSGNVVQTGYISSVDTNLIATIDKINAAHDGLAPLNPYAPLTKPVLTGLGALAISISSLIAGIKNQKKKTDSAESALKVIVKAVDESSGASEVKANVGKIAQLTGATSSVKAAVTKAKIE